MEICTENKGGDDSLTLNMQVTFFLPQLVQLLRSDDNGMIKSFLLASADRSIVFAHHLVCTLKVRCIASYSSFNKHLL